MSQLVLVLVTRLLGAYPDIAPLCAGEPSLVTAACSLCLSPLLQGETLAATLNFFEALARTESANLSPANLIGLVLTNSGLSPEGAAGNALPRQTLATLAKAIGKLATLDAGTRDEFLTRVVGQAGNGDDSAVFALLCIGEVGKGADLSGSPDVLPVVLTAFEAASEDVKLAAAFALGAMAVGNIGELFSGILERLEAEAQNQYLLLYSIQLVVTECSGNVELTAQVAPHVDRMWALLFAQCESPEEGTRNVVAECLGRLTLLNPGVLVPRLKETDTAGSAAARATIIAAVKHVITDASTSVDDILSSILPSFFAAIADENVGVRRVALVAFNSAAHSKPRLAVRLLGDVLPLVYRETVPRPELVREVAMGPFKHKVDDGLDARKAAFECMYTLLDVCPARLDIGEFIGHIVSGLRDHTDIQLLTYLMVVRLASKFPADVLARINDILLALQVALDIKLKSNAVKQEIEKTEELQKAAVRAIFAIHQLPGASKAPSMIEVRKKIEAMPVLRLRFEELAVSAGDDQSGGGASAMDLR